MQNSTIDMIIPKTLQLDSYKREIVTYSDPSFPFEIWRGDMSQYLGGGLPPHWHREIEYGLVTDGRIEYVSQSGPVILSKGEAVIVKSESMHYTRSLASSKAELWTIAWLPSLIAGSNDCLLYEKYIRPFLSLDFHIIKIEDEGIIATLEKIRMLKSCVENYEIKAMSLLFDLWDRTLIYLKRMNIPENKVVTPQGEENIKRALSYIYSHYSEKITVSDITRASFMSRNSLFRHFQSSFSKTPMEVLNDHRLSVAVSLLKEGKSMTEVAGMSGFTTPSYFSKCFHDRFGVTPGEYRRNMQKDN